MKHEQLGRIVRKKEDKPLGIFDLVGLGVGGTIGSGIFLVPAVAAGMAGPRSLFAWVLCAISFGAVLGCLTMLSRKYAVTGAFYTIFDRSYNERLSAFIIVAYIISGILGVATIAAALGQYIVIPGVPPRILEVTLVVGFGLINLAGVALSAKIEDVLTVLKILPLLIIPLLLLPYVSPENFIAHANGDTLSFLKSAVVIYWCFTGFELSAIPSRQVKDPEKSVPRSLIYVFVAVTVIYLALNFSLIGSLGAEQVASTAAPISFAIEHFFTGAGGIVTLIAIVSMLSALNAYLLGTSIVLQSFSGKYNKEFAFERRGVPVYTVILCTVLTGFLLLFTDYFVFLASASVIATLIPYLFLCYAALKYIESPWMKVLAIIGLVSTGLVLLSSFVM